MELILEPRASTIIYNVILNNNIKNVLLPANICPIVPTTLLKAKAHYEFVDISINDLVIDKDSVIEIVSKKQIDAIFFVRTYGFLKNENDFFKKLKAISPTTIIFDDRCLTKPCFNYKEDEEAADIILHSTGYSKYVDINYGGYAFLKKNIKYKKIKLPFSTEDHDKLTEKFRKTLKDKVSFKYEDSNWLDTNDFLYTPSEYKNLILKKKVEIDKIKEKLNNIYKKNLPASIQLSDDFNNWRFNILVPNKDQILQKIFDAKLFASSHYQSLVGLWGKGKDKNTSLLFSKVVNLFNDFRFDEEKAKAVCKIINENLE